MIEVFAEAITSLTQYYDQSLRCFTFGDFQLAPTIEEFEEILGCPLGGKEDIPLCRILSFYGKNRKSVQDLETRARLSEAR